MKSTGKWTLTLFLAAFSNNFVTILAPSASYKELPIWNKKQKVRIFKFTYINIMYSGKSNKDLLHV